MDDEVPEFKSVEAEARYWRSLVADLRDQLAENAEDVERGTKDLESALQEELEAAERELRAANERLKADLDDSKLRLNAALKEHSKTLAHMQRELDQARKAEQDLRMRVRDMEVDNDDLEKSDRAKSSTLADLESQRAHDIERIALLEEELVDKARLQEEVQRLKDELRDADEELSVLRQQRAAVPPAPQRPLTPLEAQPGASIEADAPLNASAIEPESTPRKLADVKRLSGIPSAILTSRIPSPRKSMAPNGSMPPSPSPLNGSRTFSSQQTSLPRPDRSKSSMALDGIVSKVKARTQARNTALPVPNVSRARRVSTVTPPHLATTRAPPSASMTRSAARQSLSIARTTPHSHAKKPSTASIASPDESPLANHVEVPRRPPSRFSVSRPMTPSQYRSPTPSQMFASSSIPRPPSSLGRPPSSLGRPPSSARRKSMAPPLPSNSRPQNMADPDTMGASMRRVSIKSPSSTSQPRWR